MEVYELPVKRVIKFLNVTFESGDIFLRSLLILKDSILQGLCALCQLSQLVLQELLVLTRFKLDIDALLRQLFDLTFDGFELLFSTAFVNRDFHLGLFD